MLTRKDMNINFFFFKPEETSYAKQHLSEQSKNAGTEINRGP